MRYLFRVGALVAAAALTVAGLAPAGAVEPSVSPDQEGPVSVWGSDADSAAVIAVPPQLQQRAIRAIDVTGAFGVAATADGHVTAWGNAEAARDGVVPAPAGLSDVVQVGASAGGGGNTAIALSADGRLTAWGADTSGIKDIPADIQGHVQAIDVGQDYVMALTDDKRIVQWGNTAGLSGLAVPAEIQGRVIGMSISSDAGGRSNGTVGAPNLALLDNNTVEAWGTPYSDTAAAAWTVPPEIQGLVTKVVSGMAPAAILKDGSVRFWGHTDDGFAPSYLMYGLPTGFADEHITDLQIQSTGSYAMALAADGDVYLWGAPPLTGADGQPYPVPQTQFDVAMKSNLAGPVLTGASAIALNRAGYVAGVITPGLAVASNPTIAGTAHVGQTLTGTAGTFSGNPDDYTASSQWLADGVALDGVTGDTLTLTAADVGKTISYQTTAVGGGKTVTATSTPTAAVSQPTAPPPSTTPPSTGGNTAALASAQHKLAKDQAKLKKAKKAYKKAHGVKKAKLKKKIKKLKKAVKKDKNLVKANS